MPYFTIIIVFYSAPTPTKTTQTNSLQIYQKLLRVEKIKIVTNVLTLCCVACLDDVSKSETYC